MIEVASTFETIVTIYQLTRCHNPEDFNPKQHRCEDIKSRKTFFLFLQQRSVIINERQCY